MTAYERVEAELPEVVADMRAFAALLSIKLKASGFLAFSYDRWNAEQKRYHRNRTRRDVVLKPRQIGFSTLELVRDVWYALRYEGVQVLIVSHDSSLCEQMFRDVRRMIDGFVDVMAGIIPRPAASSVREVVLHNGSAIRIVEAGATARVADQRGRSGTIHRLHATEVAFWGAAEATFAALMGAVSPTGEVVAESTPNGAAGTFYEMALAAESDPSNEWTLHFFPWFEHAEYRKATAAGFDPAPLSDEERQLRVSGCDDEQIAWWRAQLADPTRGGLARLKQEFPLDSASCFVMPGGAFLDAETCDWLAAEVRNPIALEPMTVTTPTPKTLGTLTVYALPLPGASYVIGADVSEGVEGDESALDVMDRKTGVTVATYASNTISPGDFGLALAWAGRRYNVALVAPERNNHGHTTLRTLSTERTSVTPYHRVFVAADGRPGWLTSSATRPPLFDELAGALRDRSTSSPELAFAQQSRTLVRAQNGKPAAANKGTKGGARDDRWIARAIAWQLRQRPSRNTGERQAAPTRGDGYEAI